MASSFPCCEIRQLLVHVYPGGSKAPGAERITIFYGRRGRPVKKPRFIPAELAHQLARKLQARRLGTVSVLCRADSKSHHGFGCGCCCTISSNAVMSCITACMPARIDRNPARRSRLRAAVRSVAIAPAPLPR